MTSDFIEMLMGLVGIIFPKFPSVIIPCVRIGDWGFTITSGEIMVEMLFSTIFKGGRKYDLWWWYFKGSSSKLMISMMDSLEGKQFDDGEEEKSQAVRD